MFNYKIDEFVRKPLGQKKGRSPQLDLHADHWFDVRMSEKKHKRESDDDGWE